MNLNKGKVIILGIVGIIVLVVVLGVVNIIPLFKSQGGDVHYPTGSVNLTMWGLDSDGTFDDIIKSYTTVHKNVKISYKAFLSVDDYQRELLNAFAESRGPDIVMLNNTWTDSYKGKLQPSPSTLLTSQMVQNAYPTVVYQDTVRDGEVWSMPLYMDALVLLYNKDMFDASAVAFPPQDWSQFVSDVVALRSTSKDGSLINEGAALGTGNNVSHFADIISVLMLQNGSAINDKDGVSVKFDDPAQRAFQFYLQFANPISPYYTWNSSFADSINMFTRGTVGMVFGYREDAKKIQKNNPFLSLGVASLPQTNQYKKKDFAHYMMLGVAKQTSAGSAYAAWDFIKTLTTNATFNGEYLTKMQRMSALRSGLQSLFGSDDDVYARAAFIARSWRAPDWNIVKSTFASAISDVLSGKVSARKALQATQEKINSSIVQPIQQ